MVILLPEKNKQKLDVSKALREELVAGIWPLNVPLYSSFVSGQTSEQNFCVDNLVSLWECLFHLLRVSQSEITTLVSL